MQRTSITVVLVFAVSILASCTSSENPSHHPDDRPGDSRSTGLALTADVFADTDIESMSFSVDPVDCQTGDSTGPTETSSTHYEEMYLPGEITAFENAPYDTDSSHLFADAYFALDAGCYDVTTQPRRDQGRVSEDCRPAHKSGVEVQDGQTTEILLVNQCEGDRRGGLDVIGSINHPPEIDDLEFEHSKFVTTCDPQRVCLSASDPDGDPLEFEFASNAPDQLGSIDPHSSATYDPQADQWTACADISLQQAGEYGFVARVFDLDGHGKRIETVLAEQHPDDDHQSRDVLAFPMYSDATCHIDAGDTGTGVIIGGGGPGADGGDLAPDTADGCGGADGSAGCGTETDTADGCGGPGSILGGCGSDADATSSTGDAATSSGCTRTRGYWSQHHVGADSPGLAVGWPAPVSEWDLLCGETYLSRVGDDSAGGDPWPQLAAQWIAASLNVASGASYPQNVGNALVEAQLLLESNCTDIPTDDEALAGGLKNLFDAYNNGDLGPGKCE